MQNNRRTAKCETMSEKCNMKRRRSSTRTSTNSQLRPCWAACAAATISLMISVRATVITAASASSRPSLPFEGLSSPNSQHLRNPRVDSHQRLLPLRGRLSDRERGLVSQRETMNRRNRQGKRRPSCFSSSNGSPCGSFDACCWVRGGAKIAPWTPQGSGKGSGASGPVLGPITRRGQTTAKKEGQGQGQGQDEFAPQFLDFQSRVGFMKKVYLTISVQLLYTGLICTLLRGYREPVLNVLFTNGMVPQVLFFIGTMATIIGTNATLWMNVELRQSFPRNLPLLTAFTTAWALYVGVFSLMFTQGSVTRAVFQAAFVVGSLTAYAFRTNPKHELTQLGAGLYSLGNAFGMFLLMKLFFFRNHRASDLALSCLATLFFSLYLVYDTYRIIGGKHRRSSQFGVKDWAVAAMALYEDIMQIFVHLLALFGEAQR